MNTENTLHIIKIDLDWDGGLMHQKMRGGWMVIKTEFKAILIAEDPITKEKVSQIVFVTMAKDEDMNVSAKTAIEKFMKGDAEMKMQYYARTKSRAIPNWNDPYKVIVHVDEPYKSLFEQLFGGTFGGGNQTFNQFKLQDGRYRIEGH